MSFIYVLSPVVQVNFVSIFPSFWFHLGHFFQCFCSIFRVFLINAGCLAITCVDFTF